MGSRSGEIEIVDQNHPGAGSHGGWVQDLGAGSWYQATTVASSTRTCEAVRGEGERDLSVSVALGRNDGERETFHQLAASSWLGLGCAASGKGKVDTGRFKIISWDFLIICARVVQLLGARNDPISPSELTPPACRAHWPPGGGRHEGRYGRVTELHRTPGRGAGEHSPSERWGGRGHGRGGRVLPVGVDRRHAGHVSRAPKGLRDVPPVQVFR